jgi:hypothetical protein
MPKYMTTQTAGRKLGPLSPLKYPRILRWVITATAYALALACVSRTQIGNGFTVLISDAADGMIQTSIMQHWYNVFSGLERWNTVAYFYPYQSTLGYNDAYFLSGLIFSGYHLFGIDPFLASELTSDTIRAVGFAAFVLFAREVLSFEFLWAVFGAFIFTISCNIYNQSGHAQLLTICFAPLLAWLLWRSLQASTANGTTPPQINMPATLWGMAAAVLYDGWLLTGFYMAWFTTFFLILVVAAASIRQCPIDAIACAIASPLQDFCSRSASWD